MKNGMNTKVQEERPAIQKSDYSVLAPSCDLAICRYYPETHELKVMPPFASIYEIPSDIKNVPESVVLKGRVASESIDTFFKIHRDADKGKDTADAEVCFLLSSGEYSWFSCCCKVVRDHNGQPASAVMIYRNIDEYRKGIRHIEELEEKVKIQRTAIRQAQKNIIIYILEKDLLAPFDEEGKLFFKKNPELQKPEVLLESPYITKNSEYNLRSLYQKMKAGIPSGNTFCRIKYSGNDKWFNFIYNTMFSTKYNSSIAVITMENVTGFHQDALALQFYKNVKEDSLARNAFMLRFNLSENEYENKEGILPEECPVASGMTYSDFIQNFSEKLIHGKDQGKFLKFMHREHILQVFLHGKTFLEESFRTAETDGDGFGWICIKGYIMQDPYCGDVEFVLICLNVSDEMKDSYKNLELQSDYVTGADSRAEVTGKILDCLKKADSSSLSAFVLLEIDSFKMINDRFGHPYGDKILQDSVQTCKSLIFEKDLLGRISGSEFILFMRGFSETADIAKKTELIRKALFQELDHDRRLTVSIGISVYPDEGSDFETLYRKADAALYQAKNAGGNQCCFYSEGVPLVRELKDSDGEKESSEENEGVYIRTFGFFDVFVNGKAILFQSAKAKELLAVMVDRRGGYVTPTDIISCLWENDSTNKNTLARCRKVAMLLRQTLKEYGIENIAESKSGSRRIIPEKVNCDLYNYLDGRPGYRNLFRGTYMANYSWGEMTLSDLQFREKPE